ncbi:MAG: hypothetical protein ABTQ34_04490 [Bdellovibrionales bacterium]
MDKETIGILSLLISVAHYAPYLHAISKGTAKPHAFSRLIWGITASVAFLGQLADGGGPGAWATGVIALASFLIAALSYNGCRKCRQIRRSDWIALSVALSAIPLWLVTRDPLWSVALVTFVNIVGYAPTFRKSWSLPHEEMIYAFLVGCLKAVVSLWALDHYSVVTMIYPLSFCICDAVLVAMLLWRRKQLSFSPALS